MQQRFVRRKTIQRTRVRKNKKHATPKFQPRQRIIIRAGAFRGRKAEILRTIHSGVIVSVIEPAPKQRYLQEPKMETRHRLVLVPFGSFELHQPHKPTTQHGKMPANQRRIALRKLDELLRLKQFGGPGSFEKIRELQRELRKI